MNRDSSLTLKATALLAIMAIWGASVAAVALHGDVWWTLVFAVLATGAVGFRRSVGLARVLAIAGVWGSAAAITASNPDHAWVTVFAFLSTGAVVYSAMERDAFLSGLGVAVSWIAAAAAVVATDGGAWITVFSFLTTGAIANIGRGGGAGALAIVAWVVAAAAIVVLDGHHWLAVFAFAIGSLHFGVTGVRFPTRLEWDFRSDDHSESVR